MMSQYSKPQTADSTADSTVDARAALALILLAVATALVWVSQQ